MSIRAALSETGKSIFVWGDTKPVMDIIKGLPNLLFKPKWIPSKAAWNLIPKKEMFEQVKSDLLSLGISRIQGSEQATDITKKSLWTGKSSPGKVSIEAIRSRTGNSVYLRGIGIDAVREQLMNLINASEVQWIVGKQAYNVTPLPGRNSDLDVEIIGLTGNSINENGMWDDVHELPIPRPRSPQVEAPMSRPVPKPRPLQLAPAADSTHRPVPKPRLPPQLAPATVPVPRPRLPPQLTPAPMPLPVPTPRLKPAPEPTPVPVPAPRLRPPPQIPGQGVPRFGECYGITKKGQRCMNTPRYGYYCHLHNK